MITILTALVLSSALAQDAKPIVCAVMHSPADGKTAQLDYAGSRFSFCCAGCDGQFKAAPGKFLTKESLKGDTIGEFLFDPTTGLPIVAKKARASADYAGVRYYFAAESGKAGFAAHAEQLAKIPAKESLVCPVSGEGIKDYASAGGYADHEGVRYYTCCANCLKALRADPKAVLAKSKAVVTAPKAVAAPKAG